VPGEEFLHRVIEAVDAVHEVTLEGCPLRAEVLEADGASIPDGRGPRRPGVFVPGRDVGDEAPKDQHPRRGKRDQPREAAEGVVERGMAHRYASGKSTPMV
jgi:hypothetical protein